MTLIDRLLRNATLVRRAAEIYSTKELLQRSAMRLLPSLGKYGLSRDDFAQQKERILSEFGSRDAGSKKRVLLVTSNGAGLGHLARLSAVASRMESETLIYTMSSAFSKIGWNRARIIYFPSSGDLGMSSRAWNPLMSAHFSAVLDAFNPDEVIFDGTFVYRGVIAGTQQENIPLSWLQRGCWKEGVDNSSYQRHHPDEICQRVIVPGDFGCEERLGFDGDIETEYVNPITLLDANDALDRSIACSELGLSPNKKHVLIQVGAGIINDVKSIQDFAADEVASLGDEWQAVLVRNPLSAESLSDKHVSVQAFPLAKYYKAFDAAVLAAGYNSVQESVQMALPSVFVPNPNTKTDDQFRRANGIHEAELGLLATTEAALGNAIRRLSSADFRSGMVRRMLENQLPNGAGQVAKILDAPIYGAGKN